jgi:hypothetical protein
MVFVSFSYRSLLCPTQLPVYPLGLIYILVFPWMLFKWTWTTQARYIPCTKSHVLSLLLRSYQNISPGPRHVFMFRNYARFWGKESSLPRPNPQDGEPLLVVCPPLLIQYIRSDPPYWMQFLRPQLKDAPCRGPKDRPIMDVCKCTKDVISKQIDFASVSIRRYIATEDRA